MSTGSKVLYIGNDLSYWHKIQERLKSRYGSVSYDFGQLYAENSNKIQQLLIEVRKQMPRLIYIDFSQQRTEYLHLARLLRRTIPLNRIIVVGLLDYHSEPLFVQESVLTGVSVNHIKTTELHDVVYDGVSLAFPEALTEAEFAKGKLKEVYPAYELVKIGYFEEDGVHFETNSQFKEGQEISLITHFKKNRLMQSPLVRVKKISETGLFYNFKFAVDAEFLYANKIKKDREDNEKLIQERERDRQEMVELGRKNLKAWLKNNERESRPKKIRLLVIDSTLSLYQGRPRSDSYPYVLRCHIQIPDALSELKRVRPHIIAIRFDTGADEVKLNTEETVKKIIEAIHKYPKYRPYLFLFNDTQSSKQRRHYFGYENLIAHNEDIEPDLLIQAASALEQKIKSSEPEHRRVYIDKMDSLSFGELYHEVTLISFSESEVILQSSSPLKGGDVLRLETPASCLITITPSKGTASGEYRGLINGVSEAEKRKLRVFVNSIFFRDKQARKQAEKEQFDEVQKKGFEKFVKNKNNNEDKDD